MRINVQSLLGKPLTNNDKPTGVVIAAHFFPENGKFAGIKTSARKFYGADHVLFQDGALQTTAAESSRPEGEDWLGFAAKTAKGHHLGEIADVEFESDIKIITRLTVVQKFLFFPISKRIFAYERIIDVRKRTVVFNCDTTFAEKIPSLNGAILDLPATQNRCFRHERHSSRLLKLAKQ